MKNQKQHEQEWLKKMKENYKKMSKEQRLKSLFLHPILKVIPVKKRREAIRLMVPHMESIKKILKKVTGKTEK